MTTLHDILNDLEAKAKAATIDYICGADTSLTRKYIHACHPDTVLTLITALREARDLAESCDKVFSIVENVGRESFSHADFAPEHKKARDWLAKFRCAQSPTDKTKGEKG